MSNVDKFLKTYSGKRMLEKHSLMDVGVWQVRGEDPNCDWGGSHYQPTLGYLSGTLASVVAEAVEMSRFWTWGGGGDITLVEIKYSNPDQAKRRRELEALVRELSEKVKDAKSELEKL